MNRNAESHFALAPSTMDIGRTMFDQSFNHTFTGNFGAVLPFFCKECLPGDTFNITTSKVIRLQTLLKPIFGNMWLDCYYFFVPNRLIWEHWVNFCGESTDAWTPDVEYTVPQIVIPDGGFKFGSVADYLGVPPGVAEGAKISALPFRCYNKIIDDWFRNQNLEDAVNVYIGDADTDANDDPDNFVNGGNPYIAGKYHDLFTSGLPGPLKLNTPVTVPVQTSTGGLIPVRTSHEDFTSNYQHSLDPVRFWYSGQSTSEPSLNMMARLGEATGTGNAFKLNLGGTFGPSTVQFPHIQFANLGVNLNSINPSISVADLRMSFQVQKFYESLARAGSRYTELLSSLWKVNNPDSRLQRSEYLGGNRMPIAVSQVTNNTQTENTPLGNVGAMSLTNDRHHDVVFSCSEFGYVVGVCVARYEHSYPQGLPKHFSRKDKFDFYWPVFANISEQPIYKKELFFDGSAEDDKVFAYQEPWAHYRYGFNTVSSEMRPNHPTSLATWNLSDDYAEHPSLSYDWAKEDKTNVDRTLSVTSEVSDQILMDFYIDCRATRPMPLYSIPGLVDHH